MFLAILCCPTHILVCRHLTVCCSSMGVVACFLSSEALSRSEKGWLLLSQHGRLLIYRCGNCCRCANFKGLLHRCTTSMSMLPNHHNSLVIISGLVLSFFLFLPHYRFLCSGFASYFEFGGTGCSCTAPEPHEICTSCCCLFSCSLAAVGAEAPILQLGTTHIGSLLSPTLSRGSICVLVGTQASTSSSDACFWHACKSSHLLY